MLQTRVGDTIMHASDPRELLTKERRKEVADMDPCMSKTLTFLVRALASVSKNLE